MNENLSQYVTADRLVLQVIASQLANGITSLVKFGRAVLVKPVQFRFT